MTGFQERLIQQGRDPQNRLLSAREVEIMRTLLRTGGRQDAAAGQLALSYHTIKNHLAVIYAKLRVHGLVEAYIRMGWLAEPVLWREMQDGSMERVLPASPQSHSPEGGR